jgi:hypothetical protein
MEIKMSSTDIQTKRPSHIIWQVTGDNDKAFWNRVGVAWPNRDGKGFILRFNSYPTTGRTVIREASTKDMQSAGRESQ